MIYTKPRNRAADMARAPLAPDLVNVSVRVEDKRAFRGIITTREKLIERKVDQLAAKGRGVSGLAEQTANCALDAFIALSSPQPDRDKVKKDLELTAALAIAALRELEGGKR